MAFSLIRNNFSLSFINFRFILFILLMFAAVYFLSFLPVFIYLFLSLIVLLLGIKYLRYFGNDELEVIFRIVNGAKWGRFLLK
jgi:hypothetical protein